MIVVAAVDDQSQQSIESGGVGAASSWCPLLYWGFRPHAHTPYEVWYDDDDNNKPVWPAWAMGALFWGTICIHINHVVSFRVISRLSCY